MNDFAWTPPPRPARRPRPAATRPEPGQIWLTAPRFADYADLDALPVLVLGERGNDWLDVVPVDDEVEWAGEGDLLLAVGETTDGAPLRARLAYPLTLAAAQVDRPVAELTAAGRARLQQARTHTTGGVRRPRDAELAASVAVLGSPYAQHTGAAIDLPATARSRQAAV